MDENSRVSEYRDTIANLIDTSAHVATQQQICKAYCTSVIAQSTEGFDKHSGLKDYAADIIAHVKDAQITAEEYLSIYDLDITRSITNMSKFYADGRGIQQFAERIIANQNIDRSALNRVLDTVADKIDEHASKAGTLSEDLGNFSVTVLKQSTRFGDYADKIDVVEKADQATINRLDEEIDNIEAEIAKLSAVTGYSSALAIGGGVLMGLGILGPVGLPFIIGGVVCLGVGVGGAVGTGVGALRPLIQKKERLLSDKALLEDEVLFCSGLCGAFRTHSKSAIGVADITSGLSTSWLQLQEHTVSLSEDLRTGRAEIDDIMLAFNLFTAMGKFDNVKAAINRIEEFGGLSYIYEPVEEETLSKVLEDLYAMEQGYGKDGESSLFYTIGDRALNMPRANFERLHTAFARF